MVESNCCSHPPKQTKLTQQRSILGFRQLDSIVLGKSVGLLNALQVDALTMQVDALTMQVDALTMQVDALTMQVDALT